MAVFASPNARHSSSYSVSGESRTDVVRVEVCQVPVAQWLAHWTSNSKVVGSSPTRDAFFLPDCLKVA